MFRRRQQRRRIVQGLVGRSVRAVIVGRSATVVLVGNFVTGPVRVGSLQHQPASAACGVWWAMMAGMMEASAVIVVVSLDPQLIEARTVVPLWRRANASTRP